MSNWKEKSCSRKPNSICQTDSPIRMSASSQSFPVNTVALLLTWRCDPITHSPQLRIEPKPPNDSLRQRESNLGTDESYRYGKGLMFIWLLLNLILNCLTILCEKRLKIEFLKNQIESVDLVKDNLKHFLLIGYLLKGKRQ